MAREEAGAEETGERLRRRRWARRESSVSEGMESESTPMEVDGVEGGERTSAVVAVEVCG